MTLGNKLSRLRKQNNYTQEQLAEVLGVSRQAISKWESDVTYPETDKLIRISELFGCSLDYLLKDSMESERKDWVPQTSDALFLLRRTFRERKSKKTCWGMPLWHIGRNARGILAVGVNACGIIAVGAKAQGVISLGLLSIGLVSLGLLSLGLLSAGLLAIGILAAGSFAVGIFAAGAISVGIISLGAIALGDFSVGALAMGKYVAIGDHAQAAIALGDTRAVGSLYQKIGELTQQDLIEVKDLLDSNVPAYLEWAKELIKLFL